MSEIKILLISLFFHFSFCYVNINIAREHVWMLEPIYRSKVAYSILLMLLLKLLLLFFALSMLHFSLIFCCFLSGIFILMLSCYYCYWCCSCCSLLNVIIFFWLILCLVLSIKNWLALKSVPFDRDATAVIPSCICLYIARELDPVVLVNGAA